jgi:hypothetical protein
VVTSINYLRTLIYQDPNPTELVLNFTPSELALGSTPANLVDMLNTRLMSGQMLTAMRTAIITRVNFVTVSQADPSPGLLNRARAAVYLIIASPQFNIER